MAGKQKKKNDQVVLMVALLYFTDHGGKTYKVGNGKLQPQKKRRLARCRSHSSQSPTQPCPNQMLPSFQL